MRDAVKTDYYWERAMEEAVKYGYEEFAMTLNPFPGATEKALEYALLAKSKGFKFINVTATLSALYDVENENLKEHTEPLLRNINVISISVDENRFKDPNDFFRSISGFDDQLDNMGFYQMEGKHLNINLLWTPTVFDWFEKANLDTVLSDISGWQNGPVWADAEYPAKIPFQHLIYKPFSLYPNEEWFYTNYMNVFNNAKFIKIAGGDKFQVGDAAFNNTLGMNDCPGNMMLDIDPMGFARKCPENPNSYDASDISKLRAILLNGVPNCGKSKCNCI